MWIWRARFKCKLDWILLVVMAGAYIILIYNIGSWSWFSFYLRYVLLFGYLSGILFSFWKVRHQPFNRKREQGDWFPVVILSLATIMFAAMFLFTLSGFTFLGESVALEFPLKKGTFMVIQGGNSPFINHHHHPESPLKYSLDITKLNTFGNRCNGFYPDKLEEYAIYGEPVYSPCAGLVKIVVEGIDDSEISEPDTTKVVFWCMRVIRCGRAKKLRRWGILVTVPNLIYIFMPRSKMKKPSWVVYLLLFFLMINFIKEMM
jgi:hypothetical protein